MKVGIVLEGGGMRGMYTAGVLDTLMDEDINIDLAIGVSAGTLFGVNYFSNQKGRALRYNKKYLNNKNYMSFYSLITTGNIINEKMAFHEIPEKYDVFDDETFINSNKDFYATITNIETGKAEYIKLGSVFKDMEVLRATSAMPYVSKFVDWNGNKYLDGGLSDSIPVLKAKEFGCDKIIVVLTRPSSYYKKPSKKFVAKMFYHKYPKLVDAIVYRPNRYNDCLKMIKQMEDNKEIFVIRPSKRIKIHRVEHRVSKLDEMYNLGIEDMKVLINNLKEYLNK